MNTSKLFGDAKVDKLVETLVSMDSKLGIIVEALSVSSPTLPTETPETELDSNSWMRPAESFIGLDEDADEAQVIEFSQTAGTPIASSETPWCAIFVNAILAMAGLRTTGTMRARDFADYGLECEEKVGAIVVYKSHVGFVPEIGKVLGGNQSDGVNIGEQSWYGTPIAYRWPTKKKG